MTKMVKRLLGGGLLSLAVLSGSANADDFEFNTKSLVALEIGHSNTEIELQDANPLTPLNKDYHKSLAGFKIGAEGEHYRVFLSARKYFLGGDFDRLHTYGGEIEYLFDFSKSFNVFIGLNVGKLSAKFKADNEDFNREFHDFYFGSDIGVNYHLEETIDIELGARYLSSKASDKTGGVKYQFDNLTAGYASIIYKFEIN